MTFTPPAPASDYRDSGLVFPPGFIFGSATASYQIEGAAAEDGRGPSIWDTFSHTPGKVWNGDTGDVAVRPLSPVDEDLDLMKELGLGAYRFSIAWPRIQPTGTGAVNQAGSSSTRGWSTGCSRAASGPSRRSTTGICRRRSRTPAAGRCARRPMRSRTTPRSWARRSATGCDTWTTLNEPWCSAYLGYGQGAHAPGRHEPAAALAAVHHLNLAHGARRAGAARRPRGDPDDSITLNFHVLRGVGDGAAEAMRRIDALANRAFTHPLLKGEYPADLLEDTASVTDWSFVQDGDLDAINQPIDVLGVNYYSTATVRLWDGASPMQHNDGHKDVRAARPGRGATGRGVRPAAGPVHGDGLEHRARGARGAARRRCRRSSPRQPLMITENGAAFDDVVAADGVGARPRARSTTFAVTSPLRTGRSSAASTCAATSCGRCSTTSSGATASRSGSASSASTSTRWSAR